MSRTISRKMKVVFGLLLAATCIVSFQNCGQPFGFEKLDLKSAANGNGTGYDGKPYVNHGVCDGTNGALEIKSTILVQSDRSGLMVRENCQDLADPIRVAPEAMKGSRQDSGVFVYNKTVYDDYAPPNGVKRKLTRLICFTLPGTSQVETENRVWYYGDALQLNANSPVLYAQETNTTGYNSGKLYPLVESVSTSLLTYTYDDDSTTENLTLSVNLGTTMNYGSSQSTNSAGAVSTVGGLDCFYQALPKQ